MDGNGKRLSAEQLEEQALTILRFLKSVHPGLMADNGFRPSVELRPIPRGEKTFMLTKSLVIWDLSEKTEKRLRTFLERHNGQATCLYYSVFTYDNNKQTLTSKGTPAKPGKITVANAISAEEIALDFDGIGFEEYIELSEAFEDLGIFAYWVGTGHGYHAHILLNEALSDKDLLKRFVYKFRSKGFFCDSACIDPARIMRLPGTFNNKCFADEDYAHERDNPPYCVVVQESEERYGLDELMEKLDSLPTVSKEDEDAYLGVAVTPSKATSAAGEKEPESVSCDPVPADGITVRKIEYVHLARFDLPPAVEKMLAYTPKGLRNKALGFMVGFFKQQYKMGMKLILETLELWRKEACVPAYDPKEFRDDFARFYERSLKYDPALAKQYGAIDFKGLIQLRKREIHIPQKFFEDFAKLDGKEVRAYLAIKMLEHVEEPTTQENIANTLGISDRALRPTIQSLTKGRHCYMKKGNARAGVPTTYHTNRINSSHKGYLTIGYNDIRAYLTELCEQSGRTRATGELKLHLYMHWKFSNKECFMSQENLGKNIGAEQNSISVMVYRLQEKHFIKIEKIQQSAFLESCIYTLLR